MLQNPLFRPYLLRMSVFLLLALTVTSCKKSGVTNAKDPADDPVALLEISPAEYASIAYDDPRELTLEEVKKIIRDYPLKSNPATKSLEELKFEIGDKYSMQSDGELKRADTSNRTKGSLKGKQITVYNINISDGQHKGNALVCADQRAPVVLAYMPKNHLMPEMLAGNLMYQNSKKYVLHRIASLEHIRDSLRTKTLEKLSGKLGKLPVKDLSLFIGNKIRITANPRTKSPVESYLPSQVISQVGPLINTQWEQEGVANQLIPGASGCTNAPAGCLVIAGAQVLAQLEPKMGVVTGYHQREVYIPGAGRGGVYKTIRTPIYENADWPLLKQFPYIGFNADPNKKLMFSRLIRDVFNNTQTTADCHGSGTQMQKMIDYLRGHIDIDNRTGFNVQQIKASLDNSRSVIGAGSRISGTEKIRHAWVVDGYAICEKNTGTAPGDLVHRYDLYLHANMGWGGSENGWFLVGTDWNLSFDVFWGERQYGIAMEMAANARRK